MTSHYAGLVLAGGQGRRMQGADKGLLTFPTGPTFAEQLLARLFTYTDELWLSCNRNQKCYSQWAQCLSDGQWRNAGPLAGIERALSACSSSHLLVVPCDTPFISSTLIEALLVQSQHNPDAIIATRCAGHRHPLHAVIPCKFQPQLEAYLRQGGRSVMGWYALCEVQWLDWHEADQLININTPEQWQQACKLLQQGAVNSGRAAGHSGCAPLCLDEQTSVTLTGGR